MSAFIASRCPVCGNTGAVLVAGVPQPGDFGVCLQCGRVLHFGVMYELNAGRLEHALVARDGAFVLAQASKATALAVVSLLDQALALMSHSDRQPGQA